MDWMPRLSLVGVRRLVPAALVVWLLCLGALLFLPVLVSSDPVAPILWPSTWSPHWWVALAVITAQAATVLLVSRAPAVAIILVALLALPLAIAGSWDSYSLTAVPILVTVYAAVSAAGFFHARLALACCAAAVVTGYAVAGYSDDPGALGLVLGQALGQAVGLVAAPAGIASMVRSRREVHSARKNEQDALIREQEARVESALARERTALARELHDIAAHHMSGMAVMASAIELHVDTAPDQAKEGARAIRDQSRLVLDDLRRLVSLLRESSGAERSVHTVSSIKELVAESPADDVELLVHSDGVAELGHGIGPLGQLVAYRMVQEALSNAAQHAAGASCVVAVDDRASEALVLRVKNAPAPTSGHRTAPGLGLTGMQERAELVGATLIYGATVEGGWEVELRIPREPGVTLHNRPQEAEIA
ncbi:histidine kinase [Nesterenkonia rhizosphaerae]|uniref:histidine kinase n=2 Tax=Nesterenkonia rhizosphaerae TaxID=1348272 RepID=A0ABP9FZD1_9MICC